MKKKTRGRDSWLKSLVRIADKGRQAFMDGVPEDQCPYRGRAGSLGHQRRSAWIEGWRLAKSKAFRI